jgi:hypothetical protein
MVGFVDCAVKLYELPCCVGEQGECVLATELIKLPSLVDRDDGCEKHSTPEREKTRLPAESEGLKCLDIDKPPQTTL